MHNYECAPAGPPACSRTLAGVVRPTPVYAPAHVHPPAHAVSIRRSSVFLIFDHCIISTSAYNSWRHKAHPCSNPLAWHIAESRDGCLLLTSVDADMRTLFLDGPMFTDRLLGLEGRDLDDARDGRARGHSNRAVRTSSTKCPPWSHPPRYCSNALVR